MSRTEHLLGNDDMFRGEASIEELYLEELKMTENTMARDDEMTYRCVVGLKRYLSYTRNIYHDYISHVHNAASPIYILK